MAAYAYGYIDMEWGISMEEKKKAAGARVTAKKKAGRARVLTNNKPGAAPARGGRVGSKLSEVKQDLVWHMEQDSSLRLICLAATRCCGI